MPNGEFVGQVPLPVPDVELAVPGVPREATSFTALFETIGDFIGGLFGGGGHDVTEQFHSLPASQIQSARQAVVAGGPASGPVFQVILQAGQTSAQEFLEFREAQGRDPITGRLPIPPPESGAKIPRENLPLVLRRRPESSVAPRCGPRGANFRIRSVGERQLAY